jgi:hypothetical protein
MLSVRLSVVLTPRQLAYGQQDRRGNVPSCPCDRSWLRYAVGVAMASPARKASTMRLNSSG